MMENSGVSEKEMSVRDSSCLSDQEVKLLIMFRAITAQRQKDLWRVLEAFTQLQSSKVDPEPRSGSLSK